MPVVWPGTGIGGGWAGLERARWQWQPALSAHDPDPPLPLESPAGGIVFEFEASGGITFGGAAEVARTKAFVAAGGITFGGAAAIARTKGVVATGGINFGGAAAVAKTKAVEGSGGITFGGAADVEFVLGGAAGPGGGSAGGWISPLVAPAELPRLRPRRRRKVYYFVASGGFRGFGGAADVEFHYAKDREELALLGLADPDADLALLSPR